MILLIDRSVLSEFRPTTSDPELRRTYYLHAGRRCILRIDGGLDLHTVAGQAVDANVGQEEGVAGFVAEHDIGELHVKVTVRRATQGRSHKRLSDIVASAPARAAGT